MGDVTRSHYGAAVLLCSSWLCWQSVNIMKAFKESKVEKKTIKSNSHLVWFIPNHVGSKSSWKLYLLWKTSENTTIKKPCSSQTLDLQLQDEHQTGGRLIGVQQWHQLVILDILQNVCLMSHLLLLLHLLAHKLHCHLVENKGKTLKRAI